jgi:3-carboxy-cis,cis-muconate cycloisomerase
MALARHMGKAAAHTLVEAASEQSRSSGKHLREVLGKNSAVAQHLKAEELDRLFAPENYLGAAQEFTDRVIAASRALSIACEGVDTKSL